MATYGNIFEFVFDSQAGAEVKILISKKSYTGAVTRRALGSAPKLKRQNNGHIYGTSLEIYAECLVDGEFAQLYTTSAYEYRVELYKNGSRLWVGHVTPELYSEPDIAPPYDVQIVATDGLGELRNYDFQSNGWNTLYQHINGLLNISGLSLAYDIVSDLFYVDANGNRPDSSSSVLNVSVDLSHKDGESCYNVLQGLLESLNAGITQHNGRWMIFRETDFISLASANGLVSCDLNGKKSSLPVVQFGSSASFQWWPVGQLNTVIEPAKKSVTVEAPNHYKGNVFAKTWSTSMGASYDETEGAYILPDNGSKISQRIEFDAEVGYRLGLRVSARNIGSGGEDQDLGIMVKIDGHVAGGYLDYYLLQQKSSDRGMGAYYWDTKEGTIAAELALPNDSDNADDAQDIDIIIPLYDNRLQGVNTRSWIYASAVEVTVYNPAGAHEIAVYDVSLSKYDQFAGYKDDVIIDNGAREASDTMEASFAQTANLPVASEVFMTGVPMLSSGYVIESWKRGSDEAADYLSVISKDYAIAVASPRMRYQGVLFVPRAASVVPALFLRDNTYYFPKTYSYDLFSDEMDIELLSIPSSEVTIGSSVIGSMTSPSTGGGASSSSGAGIGGGVSSIPDQEMSDSSANAVQNKVIKKYVDDVFAPIGKWFSEISPMFGKMADGILKVSGNLVVTGDTSSGGGAGGGETQITGFLNDLNDVTIKSQVAGDLLVYNGIEWVNTPQSSIVPNLTGYATQEWVLGKNYLTGITSAMITNALGYTPANNASLADYLPLAGGSISGNLSVNNGNIVSSYASGGIILNNGASLYFKDSTETNRKALKLISGNVLQLGSTALETAITSAGTIALSTNTSVNGILSVATDITTPLINGGTPIHSGNYSDYALPLSGGTVTGTIEFTASTPALKFYRDYGNVPYIHFGASPTSGYGEVGADKNGNLVFWSLVSGNSAYNAWNTVLHAKNIGEYALPLSGGTIAGNGAGLLAINRKDGNPVIEFYYNGSIMGRYGFATDGTPIGVVAGSQVTLLHSGNVGSYKAGGLAHSNGAVGAIVNSSGNVTIGESDTAGTDYKLDVVGKARVSDELIVTNPTGIRWAYGNYGTLFRNDGDNFYILFTDSGGALTGSWNSLRPFRISLTTGDVTMEHNLGVSGQVVAKKEMSSQNRFVLFAPYAESKGVSFGYMKATVANQYDIGIAHLGTNYGGTSYITDTSVDYTAISMYRHVVGIGKEYDYASIRAIYDKGAKLGVDGGIYVAGSAEITGATTVSNNLSAGNINPLYHNSYALGSLTKSWMSLFLVSSNNRSAGADPIVINDSRKTSGYQAIRFMRNGADYAALQWFHDGFNSSSYTWNAVSCLNLDTQPAGGTVTIGSWSDPTLIAWKDSKSIDIRGALNVGGDTRITGNLIVAGEVASYSDMRLKDVVEDRLLNIEDIANAPYFSYRWKNSEYGHTHLGTSAQYWKEIAAEYVVDGDIMTLNYASLGVGIGISIAKKTLDLEARVKILEKENEQLKRQVYGIR